MSLLRCQLCQAEYSVRQPIWKCRCGGFLDCICQAEFPVELIQQRPATMWRYREALPLESDGNIVSMGEGFTPLIALEIGGKRAWIKQDHLSPTGSYKDRGASLLVSKVQELGIAQVVEDSSGNAGSAVAGYCARGGIECRVYVPADTSLGKLAQIQRFGGHVARIPGAREAAARAAWDAAKTVYYASHVWNPYFLHGTKTFAFEVCEQLGWQAPDTVVLPVGNGSLLLGAHIGFQELRQAGVTSRLPRLIGVQAENCAPLYQALEDPHGDIPRIAPRDTLAEGIAIAEPVRGREIIDTIQMTGGDILAVSEEEITDALDEMCSAGFYLEPTAAATIAGLKKHLKTASQETTVSVFTGHGLKATEKLLR